MTICRLHILNDCTDTACVEEPNTLTGSAVPNYDGSPEALVAAVGWCSMSEEHDIWFGTDTALSAGPE